MDIQTYPAGQAPGRYDKTRKHPSSPVTSVSRPRASGTAGGSASGAAGPVLPDGWGPLRSV